MFMYTDVYRIYSTVYVIDDRLVDLVETWAVHYFIHPNVSIIYAFILYHSYNLSQCGSKVINN